jgi:hypothetical protein
MKKLIGWGVAVAVMLLLASPVPGEAGHVYFSVGIPLGVGPWWGEAPYPSAGYPYYSAPPVVVSQPPPVYTQPDSAVQPPSYWYFCPTSKTYYPYVKDCSGGWLTVVPPSASPSGPTP